MHCSPYSRNICMRLSNAQQPGGLGTAATFDKHFKTLSPKDKEVHKTAFMLKSLLTHFVCTHSLSRKSCALPNWLQFVFSIHSAPLLMVFSISKRQPN